MAKQILWEFYERYHKGNDIECTHLLFGHLKGEGMRMEVVRESDLPKAKEKFSKIISEHVYSVHKPVADLQLLVTSGSGDLNYSAIKFDGGKERSDEEMQLLRWGTIKKATVENTTNLKSTDSINPAKVEKNPAKKNGFNNLFNMAGKSKSPEKLKSVSVQESNRDSMKKDKNSWKEKDSTEKDQALNEETKGSLGAEKDSIEKDKHFVQKYQGSSKDSMEKKNSTVKNSGSKASSKKVSPQSNSTKKGSLHNFFGKQTSSKSVEVIPSEKKNDNVKKEFIEEKAANEKKNSRGKKRNRSKEVNENAKKRKRIVIQSDSSDSEKQSDTEMEEPVPEAEPETPVKPKSPSPPKVKHENGKRKVLKLVNRTYKEGEYIVTKKEHVYVSCSEDEEEKEKETRREEKKAEVKMEKLKKKQSTLTDFFKRS